MLKFSSVFVTFLHLKLDFRYSSWSFVRLKGSKIN